MLISNFAVYKTSLDDRDARFIMGRMVANKRFGAIFGASRIVSFWLAFLFLCAPRAWTAPAFSGYHIISQPDGTTVTVSAAGDEWANMTRTAAGLPVVQNPSTKYWEYAQIDNATQLRPSGRRAGIDAPDGIVPIGTPDLRRLLSKRSAARGGGLVTLRSQGAADRRAKCPRHSRGIF